jgi:mannose-6-phosphate isomerase-like protein (cupin superfamily)
MIDSEAPASSSGVAGSVTDGTELTFETVAGPDAAPPAVRVHARQDTLLRVVAGPVRLMIGTAERVLETGDEAIVPAGRPHRIAGAEGPARVVTGLRRTA